MSHPKQIVSFTRKNWLDGVSLAYSATTEKYNKHTALFVDSNCKKDFLSDLVQRYGDTDVSFCIISSVNYLPESNNHQSFLLDLSSLDSNQLVLDIPLHPSNAEFTRAFCNYLSIFVPLIFKKTTTTDTKYRNFGFSIVSSFFDFSNKFNLVGGIPLFCFWIRRISELSYLFFKSLSDQEKFILSALSHHLYQHFPHILSSADIRQLNASKFSFIYLPQKHGLLRWCVWNVVAERIYSEPSSKNRIFIFDDVLQSPCDRFAVTPAQAHYNGCSLLLIGSNETPKKISNHARAVRSSLLCNCGTHISIAN